MITTNRGLVIIVVFIILFAFILVYLPRGHRHHHTPTLICKHNLRHIHLAVYMYADDHDDIMASDVNQLIPYTVEPKVFVCPATKHKPGEGWDVSTWTDYTYVADVNLVADPPQILAYCPPENHDGQWGIIAYSNGHVERLKTEEFGARLIEEGLSYAPKLP